MKIDVTGSSGFVGRNLVPYLTKLKYEVNPVSLYGCWDKNLSPESDAIIHLAGKAHDIHNTTSVDEYFRINTDLTKQLFELFLNNSARDFIYFSSVKAAASQVSMVLDENIMPNPGTPYGCSKLKAEQFILSHELPKGKRVIILRPCMIHGPGNRGNLNLLYRMVRKGIPYPLGAYENERSFLSINNLLFIIENVLNNREISGGVYNVADDDSLSTNEVIKIICSVTGVKPRILRFSPVFVARMAKLGDACHFPFNSERLAKLTESYVVSNYKIKKALRINQLPLSSQHGLVETFRSFMEGPATQ